MEPMLSSRSNRKKHDHHLLNEDDEKPVNCWEETKSVVYFIWSFSKITALILFVIITWVWTNNQRIIGIEVLA